MTSGKGKINEKVGGEGLRETLRFAKKGEGLVNTKGGGSSV